MSKRLPLEIRTPSDIPKEYQAWDKLFLTIDWVEYMFRYAGGGFIGSDDMRINRLNNLLKLSQEPHIAEEYLMAMKNYKPKLAKWEIILDTPSTEVAQYEKSQSRKLFDWKITSYNIEKDMIVNEDWFKVCGPLLTSFFNNDLGYNTYKGSRAYVSNALFLDNWKVPLPFFGRENDNVFFGVEIEYNYLRNMIKEFTDHRRAKRREENTFFVFKNDGSLVSGVEANTAPFSVGFYNYKGKQYIRNYVEDAVKFGAKDGNNCGIHVHVSRSIGSPACRFIRNYVNKNQELFEHLGWRKENQYCRYDDDGDGNKYRAVAFHKKDTIEFRFMSSSVYSETVQWRIELVMGLVDYGRSKKFDEGIEFIDYIKSRDGYTELKKLMKWLTTEKKVVKKKEAVMGDNIVVSESVQSDWNRPFTISNWQVQTSTSSGVLTFTPSTWTVYYNTATGSTTTSNF